MKKWQTCGGPTTGEAEAKPELSVKKFCFLLKLDWSRGDFGE